MTQSSSASGMRSRLKLACVVMIITMAPGSVMAEIAPPEALQFATTDSASVTASCLRMVGALFFCLGVFAGGIHLYRRVATKAGVVSKRRMVVRERLAISSKSSLVLVSLDGKEFVVASGAENVTLVPTNVITSNSFSESLKEEAEREEVFNA